MRKALLALSLAIAPTAAHAQAFLTMEHLMLGMPRAQVLDRLHSLTCKGDRCHAVMSLVCGLLQAGPHRDECMKPYTVAGVEATMWAIEFMDERLASVYVTLPERHFGKVVATLIGRFGVPSEDSNTKSRRLSWNDANTTLVAVQRSGGSDVSSVYLSTKAHADLQRKRDRPE
jgi:hypothetical protein